MTALGRARVRDLPLSVDRWFGERVSRQVCAHHRRRLQRLGWQRALDPPSGGWAAGEPPPRAGNAVELLIDGAQALPAIADELQQARSHVHLTGWYFTPGFALQRQGEPLVLRNLLAELAERLDVRMLAWAGATLPLFRPSRHDVRNVQEELTRNTRIQCLLARSRSGSTQPRREATFEFSSPTSERCAQRIGLSNNGADDTRGVLGELIEADADAGRLLACTLYARSGALTDHVYIHAKIAIVDDAWLTVGSANLNEHSLFNDTEMNVVLHDPAVAARTRRRLWAEHPELSDEELPEDPIAAIEELWKPISKEQLERRLAGLPLTHRLARLPHLSRRSSRAFGPISGLLVDG